MSPYIFIMCMERLSRSIQQSVRSKICNPIKIFARGPGLSHLFFADDLTLFAKADINNCTVIANILSTFKVISSQKVNLSKSRIVFSRNCSASTKASYTSLLGIEEKHSFGKYLRFPIFHKCPTNIDSHHLVDTIRQRLTG